MMRLKKRFYEILEVAAPGDHASRGFDIFILSLIALNVLALVAETVESIHSQAPAFFAWFETVSVIIFTVEYLVRLWSCTASTAYAFPVRGRLRFAVTPLAVVDLLAVLPFYLPFMGIDLRFIRAVRLFRLFRLAKLGRYSTALRTLGRVAVAKRPELVITVFILGLLLLLASAGMYFIEHDAQPEAFSSIPATMWWAVATLTTVGYGDVYPVTALGKALAAAIAILGIGMFALPTGILGAAFVEQIHGPRAKSRTCPHCGKQIDL